MKLRDLNLQLKGNTKLPMSTCVKTMEPSACLQILHPAAFHFKEERVLAAHPSSCHPRRVFDNQKRKRKCEKNEEKEKKRELLKGSLPILLMSKSFSFSLDTVHRSLYTAPAKQNYKKNQNQKLLQGIKWEENQKKDKKKKQATGRNMAG